MGKTVTIGWATTDRTEEIDESAIPLYTEVKGGVVVIDADGQPTNALEPPTKSASNKGADNKNKDDAK